MIVPELSVDEIQAMPCRQVDSPTPYRRTTPHDEYAAAVTDTVDALQRNGGKTVLSRVICATADGCDWGKIAVRYFDAFPSTFRFIYFTPQTGAWLGASPETLLNLNTATGTIETMSLAGTRNNDDPSAWDDKNLKEHNFVTDYIVATLAANGITATVGAAEDVSYGALKHLCHRITGSFSGNIMPLLHSLSPTPALAGTPLKQALHHIKAYEAHPRRCYGGYVGVKNGNLISTFVNLRSVHFSDSAYCIYAGSGITADSDVETEWLETKNKVARLQGIIATK
jgi:isochorismate synthase